MATRHAENRAAASVVPIEFGQRFGRRPEFNDITAPRSLDGFDGRGVGYQRTEVGPATRRCLLKHDAHGLVYGEACSLSWRAASSLTSCSTSTRTVTFIRDSLLCCGMQQD